MKNTRKIIKNNISGYPAYIIGRLVESLEFIFDNVIGPEIKELIVSLAEACRRRFTECRECDLKEIESITAKGFFGLINAVLIRAKCINKEDIQKIIEAQMLINYIKSDNLMRKLQGIAMLKDSLKISELCKKFCLYYLNSKRKSICFARIFERKSTRSNKSLART